MKNLSKKTVVINFSKAVITCHRFHFCGKKKPPSRKEGANVVLFRFFTERLP